MPEAWRDRGPSRPITRLRDVTARVADDLLPLLDPQVGDPLVEVVDRAELSLGPLEVALGRVGVVGKDGDLDFEFASPVE
jgi:hypothetical protein